MFEQHKSYLRRVFFWLIILAAMLATAQDHTPDAWLEDFHQLLGEISSHYANFEWVANDRRADLPTLKARTDDRLRRAKSDEDAHRTLERFLRAFGDGHVEIRFAETAQASSLPKLKSFCQRMGYNQPDQDGGIDFFTFPEYLPLKDADSEDFPGGILRLRNHGLGIVRIGLFGEHAHPGLCAEVQRKLGIADDAKCEGDCEDQFEFAVGDLLTAALERRLAALQRAGADSILVDITGNGGGTNWVEPAARVMTPVPLHSPQFGFVKHQHWVTQLQDRLRDIESDLEHATAADREVLVSAEEKVRRALAEVTKPCDRNLLWSNPPSSLHCSQLVTGLFYASGTLPYAKPGAFRQLKSGEHLFSPAAYYHYHEGANRLPLLVLVDSNTASSAEYFAAMLQDNKAATIVGQLTAGAGCGFTNGGIPTVLKNSGARVRLPDCVRFRADGSDEVSGVTPNILLPWADRDSRYQESIKLKGWLESAYGKK